MTLSKMFTASLLGVMSFSSGAMARDLNQAGPDKTKLDDIRTSFTSRSSSSRGSSTTNSSSSRCTAIAIGYSEVENNKTRAEAAVETAAYMCGEGDATAEAIAEATASAFALAVASSSVYCELDGQSTGRANAYAQAEATAQVWLEAYAEAAATAVQCDKCEAFIYGWSYIGQEVFLNAVASTKANIDAYADGFEVIHQVTNTQTTIHEAVVTAYAEALAGAKAVYDTHECAAYGKSEGCIITEEKPEGNCTICVMHAVSLDQIVEVDAIAEASADAGAYTCGDDALAYADTSVSAKAIAEAMAIAVSYLHVNCEAAEGGYACADVGTHIKTSAHAVAQAYAEAWAGAVACDECEVNVDAAVSAVEEILVEAATEAYGFVCVEEGTAWTLHDLQVHIEAASLEAVAEALAYAVSSKDSGFCAAAVTVDTYVGPSQ